jgi:large subunit ribosomal protein L9
VVTFGAKAGDTGKLYGSITTQDVATAISEQTRFEVKKQQVDMQPIRNLGEFIAHVRLTVDLMPEVKIIVHREGEALEEEAAEEPVSTTQAEAPAEVPAEAAESTEA